MMLRMLVGFVIVAVAIQASAQPLSGEEKKDEEIERHFKAVSYLYQYGYATLGDAGQMMAPDDTVFKQDLRDLQKFAGIPQTGKVDAATITLMNTDRCGDRDRSSGDTTHRRQRRYNHQGTKWENELNLRLRWRLFGKGRALSHDVVRGVLTKAFEAWTNVTNLIITETPNEAEPEIKVKFVTRRHGDPFPFDGTGGVLAHAFYPLNNKGISGDVHFDDDEPYVANQRPNKHERDLGWVAIHEIGHSIGLDHSAEKDAIMYPWYPRVWKPNLGLRYDDILGIQKLYGGKIPNLTPKPTTPTTKPTTTQLTTPKAIPKVDCRDKQRAQYCRHYKYRCFGDSWSSYMKGVCEMTCGYCVTKPTTPPKPTVPICKNKLADVWCAKRLGNCHLNNDWGVYMKTNCAKHCGYCKTTKGATPKAVPKVDCRNKRHAPFCGDNKYRCFGLNWISYMKNVCEMTCGYCVIKPTTPPKPTVSICKNKLADEWCAKKIGNCQLKNVYMKTNCAKHCGYCKNDPVNDAS